MFYKIYLFNLLSLGTLDVFLTIVLDWLDVEVKETETKREKLLDENIVNTSTEAIWYFSYKLRMGDHLAKVLNTWWVWSQGNRNTT